MGLRSSGHSLKRKHLNVSFQGLQTGKDRNSTNSGYLTHICSRQTADSGTWWPQTSQRRIPRQQVSGRFHTSPSSRGPLRSGLWRKKMKTQHESSFKLK